MYLALAHPRAFGNIALDNLVVYDGKTQPLGEPGSNVLAKCRHLARHGDHGHGALQTTALQICTFLTCLPPTTGAPMRVKIWQTAEYCGAQISRTLDLRMTFPCCGSTPPAG